ncbi:hypothetical protein HY492_00485, partial [Candidatus Woesearchaeota archaeon]|nr:hypothetical protein [Candidatus Woesearchaeota archaeon]
MTTSTAKAMSFLETEVRKACEGNKWTCNFLERFVSPDVQIFRYEDKCEVRSETALMAIGQGNGWFYCAVLTGAYKDLKELETVENLLKKKGYE